MCRMSPIPLWRAMLALRLIDVNPMSYVRELGDVVECGSTCVIGDEPNDGSHRQMREIPHQSFLQYLGLSTVSFVRPNKYQYTFNARQVIFTA